MKEVFILSYGCNLDHSNINYLVKERLIPFSVNRAYWRNEKPPKESEICLIYDVFDINRNKHKDNLYYLDKFYINEVRLESFLYSLSKLKGNHVYAKPNVRGHAYVQIDNVEYTGRIYKTLEDGVCLVFLDEESEHNIELREKLPFLPSGLHFLKMSNDLSLEDSNTLVAEWIQRIINEVGNKK
ncbi:hypothetical protein ACQKM9_12770 [Viridibacillus sp. NPDC093762]|uniref:hypothetical protein n=1 Tax=Viridibacillus sp. NPDC093762 TaxID=3390720 RepID=UPI003D0172EC